MVSHPQIFLDSKRARSFVGQHPWVLDRSVIEPVSPVEPGQIVELLHPDGAWIGRGIYNPASRIRVRLYQWNDAQRLDDQWCVEQLRRSVELRSTWMQRHGSLDAVRLVNSEGDGLSGLILDRFGDTLVLQVTALAMLGWLDAIVQWLEANLKPKGIFLRMDPRTAANEGMEVRDELLSGEAPAGPIEFQEHGVRIKLDLLGGQKTGYYLDQRANRLKAAKWMGAGPMLDACCYLGGFSLAACRWAEPTEIIAVDSSARALEQARANADLNEFSQIEFVQADCFDYLKQLETSEKRFQTVVLDPPRMAGNRSQVGAALRAYHRLNLSALRLLNPGGMLITCSCSGRVSRGDFAGVLASVGKREKRSIQVVESLGADADHPVDLSCPEGEYLKCFVCRVG